MTDRAREFVPNTANAKGAPPAALMGYQQRWVADKSPFKIMEKGRRTGITWAEASDNVLIAASDKTAGGQNVYYVGTDKEMTEEYIDACAMWAKVFNYAAGSIEEGIWQESADGDKEIKTFTIRFPKSGHKIIALASRPRKLRGRQGVLVGDEGAFQDSLEELIKAAMAFLIWGGKVRIISTHDSAENPFAELVELVRAGKRKGTIHRVTFRDAVADGLFKRVCMRMGKDWTQEEEDAWVQDLYEYYGDGAEEELDCVPSKGGGIWLPRALIEARMVTAPVIRYRAPKGMDLWNDHLIQAEITAFCERELKPVLDALDPTLASYFGQDFGRYSDLTVMAPCQLTAQLRRRFPFLVELADTPFVAQKLILFYILSRLPRLSYGRLDAGGNGSFLAEEARRQFGEQIIEQVLFTEAWYRDNTAPVKAAFEDGSLEVPKDADVQDDLAAFKIIKGVPRLPDLRTKGKSGEKRHGDAGIAILLAYSASRFDAYQPFAYESVRPGAGRSAGGRHDDDEPRFESAGWRSKDGVI